MTPTQRSKAKLRAEGWTTTPAEQWIPASPAGYKGPLVRKDAFGFGDILAVKIGVPGATLVQVTSGSNVAARIAKIRGIAEAGIWMAAGNRIEVHGWRKVGAAGKRKLWECRVVEMQCSQLEIKP